jgi:hypothetical protein
MTPNLHLPSTKRGRLVTALVVLLAVVIGLGGGTALALWRDSASTRARMPVGVAVFGMGAPGQLTYAAAETDDLVFRFGPSQAQQLLDNGVVAIPIQVDSLSQGHRGLTYTVVPDITGGLFGAGTWTLTRVPSAAACTPLTTGTTATGSTPWTAAYAGPAEPIRSEFWCLVANSVTGTHTNTVTVTGTPDVPGGLGPVTATDQWRATVGGNPAAEPTHTLTFDFRTFRPGAAP